MMAMAEKINRMNLKAKGALIEEMEKVGEKILLVGRLLVDRLQENFLKH